MKILWPGSWWLLSVPLLAVLVLLLAYHRSFARRSAVTSSVVAVVVLRFGILGRHGDNGRGFPGTVRGGLRRLTGGGYTSGQPR